MEYAEAIITTAAPGPAWAALSDVTSYPRWTASMSAVTPLDGPALAPGNRFRIRQPGLPATVWRVCELHEGTSFAWKAHALGVHTLAYHRIDPQPDGTTRISIGIRQTGALAGLVALLTAARTRRYLRLEAAGLKAAAEAAAGSAPGGGEPGEAGSAAAGSGPGAAGSAAAGGEPGAAPATDDGTAPTGGR